MPHGVQAIDRLFIETAFALARRPEVRKVLFVSDVQAPEDVLKSRLLKPKFVQAVTGDNRARQLREAGFTAIVVPDFEYDRLDRIKVAVASAINAGVIVDREEVLCLTGPTAVDPPDTLLHTTIGEAFEEGATLKLLKKKSKVPSQVFDAALEMATRIGFEGYEGRAVGTIITVGDSARVLEKSKQLTLNPFQGHPEADRNIMDPQVREAVSAFAVLDGAFVVREDGVVLAAGRFLLADEAKVSLPLGLGTRHSAAAAMSLETEGVVLVISETTGTVRIFQKGELLLEVTQQSRRG